MLENNQPVVEHLDFIRERRDVGAATTAAAAATTAAATSTAKRK